MWRFFVAAAVLVAAFVFVVTLRKMPAPDLRVSARASGTPSASRMQAPNSSPAPEALGGDAPWALSALPDCARQRSEDRGSAAAVRAKIPSTATAAVGRIRAGACAVEVTADGIIVQRGHDRLRIPPPARLLYWNNLYYLYEDDRKGAVLRIYSFL